jgi:hypothetical protein
MGSVKHTIHNTAVLMASTSTERCKTAISYGVASPVRLLKGHDHDGLPNPSNQLFQIWWLRPTISLSIVSLMPHARRSTRSYTAGRSQRSEHGAVRVAGGPLREGYRHQEGQGSSETSIPLGPSLRQPSGLHRSRPTREGHPDVDSSAVLGIS